MSERKEREIIAIIGRTNAGKSSLLNLISDQKDYAIVDKTPGTTADTVVTLMEIHDIGPVKILDTAGVDEYSELGYKKREKTYQAMEEADLTLIVIGLSENYSLDLEKDLIQRLKGYKKQVLVIINIFDSFKETECEAKKIEKELNLPVFPLKANDRDYHSQLIEFIKNYYHKDTSDIDLLPDIKQKGFVLLVIPMDEETPALRLLRPQNMAIERLLRKFSIPVLFRLNLKNGRSDDKNTVDKEYERYISLVNLLKDNFEKLQLIITDSQAFDIISRWTPDEVNLTSFSIMMAHYMSKGNFKLLLDGVKAVDDLKKGDNILVVEACNHNRQCEDIGTVQIPRILKEKVGGELNFDFSFGRPFSDENLIQYNLILHCGACMIDRQKYARRLLKAKKSSVPITNYGIFLSYMQNKKLLERVTQIFT